MEHIPLSILISILFLLLVLSAFFSGAETSMMSFNRYRLKHLCKIGYKPAQRVQALLNKPDRLISIILLGNNFLNTAVSALATIIALRVLQENAIAAATLVTTFLILIFSEVTPKTWAALHPEKIAFTSAIILRPLLFLFHPLIVLVNIVSNGLLRLMGTHVKAVGTTPLSHEELRTLIHDTTPLMPNKHRAMLLSILELQESTVEDIMIPRNEIFGIDIDADMDTILQTIRTAQHTRIPIYKGNISNPIGIIHARKLAKFLTNAEEKNKANLLQYSVEPYYTLKDTSLSAQLTNFQKQKRRVALVVNEYGDVLGLVSLEDILEEIVGEFTTDVAASSRDILPQEDGSYIVDGSATLREINRALKWNLPINGPKTLNGLITEHLEMIAPANVSLKINHYLIEVLKTKDNMVKSALLRNIEPLPDALSHH